MLVEVYLGGYRDAKAELFGPLPARRARKFALLDLGVSLGMPCWRRRRLLDGSVLELPPTARDAWYVRATVAV